MQKKESTIKISAVIITLNEERNIERCIRSLLKVSNEILVVDSFSTDKTEEICKKYDVKFIQHPFKGFGQQKQYGVLQATYDWILSLDADEALSDELIDNLLEIKENATYDIYSFNRMMNYCGKWIKYGAWYPEKKVRLFNRKKTTWSDNYVHETVLLRKDLKQKHLEGYLYHYNYLNIEEHVLQMNKFSTLSAEEMFKKDKKISLLLMFFKSSWRFIYEYVFRLGFVDGYEGLKIALIHSFYTKMKYLKLYDLNHKK